MDLSPGIRQGDMHVSVCSCSRYATRVLFPQHSTDAQAHVRSSRGTKCFRPREVGVCDRRAVAMTATASSPLRQTSKVTLAAKLCSNGSAAARVCLPQDSATVYLRFPHCKREPAAKKRLNNAALLTVVLPMYRTFSKPGTCGGQQRSVSIGLMAAAGATAATTRLVLERLVRSVHRACCARASDEHRPGARQQQAHQQHRRRRRRPSRPRPHASYSARRTRSWRARATKLASRLESENCERRGERSRPRAGRTARGTASRMAGQRPRSQVCEARKIRHDIPPYSSRM